ncbi:hypothetical protein B0H12DRAFT_1136794 [Mycena haematopus]|nr:hypothetical protein B0H12DRAFT_1136794 [Mycena haematopus]
MGFTLPPELEELIFHIAAHRNPEMIPTFLCVARRIHIWLEPLLYRTIVNTNTRQILAVIAAMSSKPAPFFQKAVRNVFLGWDKSLPPDETRKLLGLSTGIENLAIFGHLLDPSLLPLLADMPLRRLITNLAQLFGAPLNSGTGINLTHPLFASLTHLTILQAGAHRIPPSQLAALPALTHLCVRVSRIEWQWDAMRALLDKCAKLEVLLALWSSTESKAARLTAERTPWSDPRFVVAVLAVSAGASIQKSWEAGTRGGVDFWIEAETLVARKRIKETTDMVLFKS